jgi:DNA relaxase NicK
MGLNADTDGMDGYCATIFQSPQSLFDDLGCLLESAGFDARPAECGKVRFYSHARDYLDDKGYQLLQLKWGGSNPHPHLECFGRAAPFVASYLRDNVGHQPTRIDHAIDLRSKGAFDRIYGAAVRLCREHGLRGAPAGDWVSKDGGRTFYVGSRSSQVYVRIYEKGIKYARDLGEAITPELREWVRVELEFKPQNKVAREIAKTIDGVHMWGSTGWTDQLAKEVLGVHSEPVNIRQRRESNQERALRFMGSQYSAHLTALFEQNDKDFCEFGRAVAILAGIADADY